MATQCPSYAMREYLSAVHDVVFGDSPSDALPKYTWSPSAPKYDEFGSFAGQVDGCATIAKTHCLDE